MTDYFEPLTIVEQRTTCAAAPVQIEGKLSDGRYFYFRSRHRSITLGLSYVSIHAAVDDPNTVGFDMTGWEDDRHALSWISEESAQALLGFLLALYQRAERWQPTLPLIDPHVD